MNDDTHKPPPPPDDDPGASLDDLLAGIDAGEAAGTADADESDADDESAAISDTEGLERALFADIEQDEDALFGMQIDEPDADEMPDLVRSISEESDRELAAEQQRIRRDVDERFGGAEWGESGATDPDDEEEDAHEPALDADQAARLVADHHEAHGPGAAHARGFGARLSDVAPAADADDVLASVGDEFLAEGDGHELLAEAAGAGPAHAASGDLADDLFAQVDPEFVDAGVTPADSLDGLIHRFDDRPDDHTTHLLDASLRGARAAGAEEEEEGAIFSQLLGEIDTDDVDALAAMQIEDAVAPDMEDVVGSIIGDLESDYQRELDQIHEEVEARFGDDEADAAGPSAAPVPSVSRDSGQAATDRGDTARAAEISIEDSFDPEELARLAPLDELAHAPDEEALDANVAALLADRGTEDALAPLDSRAFEPLRRALGGLPAALGAAPAGAGEAGSATQLLDQVSDEFVTFEHAEDALGLGVPADPSAEPVPSVSRDSGQAFDGGATQLLETVPDEFLADAGADDPLGLADVPEPPADAGDADALLASVGDEFAAPADEEALGDLLGTFEVTAEPMATEAEADAPEAARAEAPDEAEQPGPPAELDSLLSHFDAGAEPGAADAALDGLLAPSEEEAVPAAVEPPAAEPAAAEPADAALDGLLAQFDAETPAGDAGDVPSAAGDVEIAAAPADDAGLLDELLSEAGPAADDEAPAEPAPAGDLPSAAGAPAADGSVEAEALAAGDDLLADLLAEAPAAAAGTGKTSALLGPSLGEADQLVTEAAEDATPEDAAVGVPAMGPSLDDAESLIGQLEAPMPVPADASLDDLLAETEKDAAAPPADAPAAEPETAPHEADAESAAPPAPGAPAPAAAKVPDLGPSLAEAEQLVAPAAGPDEVAHLVLDEQGRALAAHAPAGEALAALWDLGVAAAGIVVPITLWLLVRYLYLS